MGQPRGVEEVRPGFYRLVLPLPMPSLRTLNSYLLLGGGMVLLVDTGLGHKCRSALLELLSSLGLRLQDITDILVTHFHVDHLGLAYWLKEKAGARVLMNAIEWDIITEMREDVPAFLAEFREFFRSSGVPKGVVEQMLARHPLSSAAESYTKLVVDEPLRDGDVVRVGSFSLRVLLTPGHSPGHTCLYEAGEKLLISGDHVLPDITPNVMDIPGRGGTALEDYLSSLDRMSELDVKLVLPGHRSPFKGLRKRVEELRQHHLRRLSEILSILGQRGPMTAYEIASKISWDVDYPSWEVFPAYEKSFAIRETLAHLAYLVRRGLVEEFERGGVMSVSYTHLTLPTTERV